MIGNIEYSISVSKPLSSDPKMSCEIASNLQRQEDEVAALASIYDETEFFFTRSECIKCTVSVYPKFPQKLQVKFTDSCPSDMAFDDSIYVKHLPPIRLYMYLPNTYPSKTPPKFYISIVWLTPWELSFVCQKFDEIWEENQGNEIIFLWLTFLQNDIFSFLNMWQSLDVSFLHLICTSRDKGMLRLARLSDHRAQNGALSLDIKKLLISYNKRQHQRQFDKNFYTCSICFEEHTGLNCIELENCEHVYCKSCMKKHITIGILEYSSAILCPTIDCRCKISENDIKLLCPDLFPKYEENMLQIALATMDDVIFCPQTSCRHPFVRNQDDNAPICPACKYCFCIYCLKLYHGHEPCDMTSADTIKLIDEYKNSNYNEKNMLEKKYGKRQILSIEKYLTTEYLQDNAKSCPKCRSFISKIEGCNKMTCGYCQSSFCWLCNEQIYGYDHFNNDDSPCRDLLFEGLQENDIDYDMDDLMNDVVDDVEQFVINTGHFEIDNMVVNDIMNDINNYENLNI